MNRERILQLADEIEAMPYKNLTGFADSGWIGSNEQPTGFNMKSFGCGTAACIGGHAAYRQRQEDPGTRYNPNGLSGMASKWLGIDPQLGDRLYYPAVDDYDSITPKQAARVLRHLAETGKVDWSIIE